MRSSSSLVFILAALSAAAGCSDPVGSGNNTPVDSGNPATDRGAVADTGTQTPTDGGTTMDTGTVTPTDGGTTGDRPGVVDAGPPVDPCAAASVIDLNAMGMRSGATTRITRSNATVARNSTVRANCQNNSVAVTAFRYTPTATGPLAVSTDNAGTTPNNFDTVAWAYASCAAPTGDAGSGSLGCNDDSATAPRTLTSRFTTTAPVTAGTPIYIFVGGYGSATASTGTFELSVTEITTVAVGGACDPMRVMNICATGSACVTASGASTCVADGTAGRPCRMAEPRCDTGLACSATSATASGVCRRSIAAGGACAPGSTDLCATGNACLPTTATAGTCSMTTTAETEPNNTPAAAQATITAARIYSGMATNTDADCFHVTIPMGAGLFAESTLPATPTCPSGVGGGGDAGTGSPDPVIQVYNPANTEIEDLDDADDATGRGLCGTVNPTVDMNARNLAAGVYTVCIKAYNTTPINYLLTIGIIPGA